MFRYKVSLDTKSQKVLFLEYLTILWNVGEGLISVSVGIATHSVALVAFGLESGIEVFSSSVVVWQFKKKQKTQQRKALTLLGGALLLFSFYITIMVGVSLAVESRSVPTILSLVALGVISLGMCTLGLLKRRLGREMKSSVVLVESRLTLLDAALSGSLLIGFFCSFFFGWWWVDPLFALLIAGNAFTQAIKQLRSARLVPEV